MTPSPSPGLKEGYRVFLALDIISRGSLPRCIHNVRQEESAPNPCPWAVWQWQNWLCCTHR